MTYDEVVREMMLAEGQYIRDLNMIIKVLHVLLLRHNCWKIHVILSEMINGWCVADKLEPQPLWVCDGLWEDILLIMYSHSRPKQFSQQDLAPSSALTAI